MYLKDKMEISNNRPTGFDYMRIVLALLVIWVHTDRVLHGGEELLFQTELRPFLKSILPMFFVLSGFLVAGSLERSKSLVSFLGNRLIRIYPALAVEVFLSALVLGMVFTTLPLSEYFTHAEFYRYLVNVTGHIHFFLPGVFESNPDAGTVNAQLWTVPYELKCYIVIAALFVIGIVRYRVISIIAPIALVAVYAAARYWSRGDDWADMPTVTGGNLLIASFLLGVCLYLYRDKVRWDYRIFALAVASVFAGFWFTSMGDFIALPGAAYATVFLGLCSPRKLAVLRGADYSYGVFLYGYPIQQAVVSFGGWGANWIFNGFVSCAIALVFAAFSWTFVEKPALKLKKYVLALEEIFLAQTAKWRMALGMRNASAPIR